MSKKKIPGLLILAVAAVGLGGTYFALASTNDPARTGVLFAMGNGETVESISLTNTYGSYEFTKEDDEWIVHSDGDFRTNPEKMDLLVSSRYIRELDLTNPLFLLAIFTVVLIAVLYWFFGTELGCALRATGANQAMARAQGINTNWCKVLGLVVSNGLVALSGALLAQYQGSSTVDMGRGAIVIGLAAVIIGEVLLGKVFRNFALKLLSAVIGSIIYYIVLQFVLRLGLESTDLKLLSAVVVALFLSIPYWKGKYFTKTVRKEAARNA